MANEKRLIDANMFPLLPNRLDGDMSEYERGYLDAQENLNLLPTVDAVEVVHGRWENSHGIYSCSVCGKSNPYEVLGDNIWYWPCNYCPNCGAKMDGDGDG